MGALPYASFVFTQPDGSYYGLEIIMCDAMAAILNFRWIMKLSHCLNLILLDNYIVKLLGIAEIYIKRQSKEIL